MDVRGRLRRNWIIFGVVLVGVPVLFWVGLGVLFAMNGLFYDAPR
jgi:hypothetical protein